MHFSLLIFKANLKVVLQILKLTNEFHSRVALVKVKAIVEFKKRKTMPTLGEK